jgi:hypothetical protein
MTSGSSTMDYVVWFYNEGHLVEIKS